MVLRAGRELNGEALVAWARANMANYKVPRHVMWFDSFPVNASNKVLKRELAQTAIALLAPAQAAAG